MIWLYLAGNWRGAHLVVASIGGYGAELDSLKKNGVNTKSKKS